MIDPFHPFHVTGLFLYPLKMLENFWFTDVFKGYKKRPEKRNGFIAFPK